MVFKKGGQRKPRVFVVVSLLLFVGGGGGGRATKGTLLVFVGGSRVFERKTVQRDTKAKPDVVVVRSQI